ncbi:hypothetical protein PRVXT_001019 [Proteinivorax tanatarense]|uniref:Uncharacterized protein n=1 Tax=Proteinivorax tanatarense TaxID=1260629 RepID=A0AAU7VP50_9FIRM
MHKIDLSKFIKVSPNFQYSINLKYDFNSRDKVKSYIPTSSTYEIFEDFLLSMNKGKSNGRAKLLTGPYGKGKSHLVLMLLAFFYYKNKNVYPNFLEKMKEHSPKLYKAALEEMADNKKMLPVIVSGSNINIKQSFLQAIKNSLDNEGIEDIMPETYFNAAVAMIRKWSTEYPETLKRFTELTEMDSEKFIKGLENYSHEYYQQFLDVYPKITSGSEFNPLQDLDIVELYEDVLQQIKPIGYKGLFIVYDEFSKYLEGSIDRNSASEIKFLQDLAEKCNKGGKEDEVFQLLLITHKSISSYVDRLPKEKVDAWKAVAERFKTIEISHADNQTYELMSNTIIKDHEVFTKFKDDKKEEFKSLYKKLREVNNGENLEEQKTIVEGCYPLHPLSSILLPSVSEKVAQNERTIFTFLSADDKNTLGNFLKKDFCGFTTLTPDYIYDYFEPLFKKENYTSDTYKTWRDAKSSLTKVSTELERKIIKTLCLIYIVGNFRKIPPTKKVIIESLSHYGDEKEVMDCIEKLISSKNLYYVKSKGYLKFIEATDIDVQQLINDTKELRKNTYDKSSPLNINLFNNFILATRYNVEREIRRYFSIQFIDTKELSSVENWDKKLKAIDGDGVLYCVTAKDSADIDKAKDMINNIEHDRIVFVTPKDKLDIDKVLGEYDAIKYLIDKNAYEDKDPLLNAELEVYLEDTVDQLFTYLSYYLYPEHNKASYFYKGEQLEIKRRTTLNKLVSDICYEVYHSTPVIPNELINVSKPSNTAQNYRRKVLEGLLQNRLQPSLGLIGHGLDVTIMRATLINTNILKESNGQCYVNINGDDLDPNIKNILSKIREFFLLTTKEGKTKFSKLYEVLTEPKHGIGLRRGLIPIFLSVVLHEFKNNIVITQKGMELVLDGKLVDSINTNPELYEAFLEDLSIEKENYLKDLEGLFEGYVLPEEKEYNSFDYVVKGIQRWYFDLPKFAKEYKQEYLGSGEFNKLPKNIIKIRNKVKQFNPNANELLFTDFVEVAGSSDYKSVFEEVEEFKNKLDRSLENLLQILSDETQRIFGGKLQQESLPSALKNWYEALDDFTKKHVISNSANSLLETSKDPKTNNPKEIIKKLSIIITGLRIEDWNENSIMLFLEKLTELKNNIDELDKANINQSDAAQTESYVLTYIDENGEKKDRILKKKEPSNTAKILLNELTTIFEEYGAAVDENDKRQILMEMLQKMC